MNLIQFQHADRALLLLAVLAAILFVIWRMASQRSHLRAFVGPAMQPRLVSKSSVTRQVLQVACLALSGIGFTLALMQPQIVQKEQIVSAKDAANIFVALDVSKSMMAADVAPNRLERAKSEVRDMLPAFSSHNVGLLAFAGRTTVLSPLTMDHGFFRLVLDSASIESVTLGGTNIGGVITKATKLLEEHEGPKALILISDGEDHDSYPIEAAEAARRAGVVIVTVGFGSENGTPIDILDKETGRKKRITDSSGAEVISRLDGKLMRDIALKTDGVYVPAATGVLDLENIINTHILPLVSESTQVNVRENRIDLFQWFVGIALLFFAGFILLEGRSLKSARRVEEAV